jgi:hypothetical protein
MATEIKTLTSSKAVQQYPDDVPIATFEQNLEIEERLISTIEAEIASPPVDANKFKIRLRELSTLNQEIRNQINLSPGLIDQNPTFAEKSKRSLARIEKLFAIAKSILVDNSGPPDASQGNTPPPSGPIDKPPSGGDDGRMEKRIEKLEADVAAIKIDLAVIKANGATKSDIAELKGSFGELRAATKGDIADAKTTIILWVVGAIFIAQLLPAILKLFVK